METAIKTLETSLAERNAAIRILQSKNSATHNMSVNNIDEILAARMGVAVAGTPVTPSQAHAVAAHAAASAGDNILNIPILNSQTSPHKKQFSMPSVLATPPQYHSLNLSKKLGHAQHRSLTPSADMFLRGSAGSQQQQTQHSATEYIRSATPSADILRAAPTAEHMAPRATPSSSNADIIRTAEILRATPTSAELHRLSAPADMLRGAPIEMLRSTPTHEMIRATPTHEIFRGGNPTQTTAVSMATANEMLRQQQLTDHMIRATPTGTTPNIVASGTGVEPTHKRREPSGTSTGDSFQHPGPT